MTASQPERVLGKFLAEQGNEFIAEMLHVVFRSDSEDTGQKCEEGGEVGVGREVVKVA